LYNVKIEQGVEKRHGRYDDGVSALVAITQILFVAHYFVTETFHFCRIGDIGAAQTSSILQAQPP
jgi:hypothetical protein